MFRFLKRNDSEVITPEVVDMPVVTVQSNIAMALALFSFTVCGEKNQRIKCLKNINVLTI